MQTLTEPKTQPIPKSQPELSSLSGVDDHLPVIGVTGSDHDQGISFRLIQRALSAVGARVTRLTPDRHDGADEIDGLILAGGSHIAPTHSRIEAQPSEHPSVHRLAKLFRLRRRGETHDDARDMLELQLLLMAESRNVPVLGICRGMQIINVSRGGTLVAAESQTGGKRHRRSYFANVAATIDENSKLAEFMEGDEIRINALHEQCVGELGRNLRIVARSGGGVPQAIEDPASLFLIGVQWHPEYLLRPSARLALFRALVDASKARQTDCGSIGTTVQQ